MKKIKKFDNKNKNIFNNNKINKKRLKLNEHLLIKNEETYDDIKNKEIEFEFSNENLSNNLNSNNNILISKVKMKEIDDKRNVYPLKKEMENLDEEM
jgi:hypothetical protein